MISVDGYTELRLIGAGGLGDVYRATSVATGDTVAIKVLRHVADPATAWRRARREFAALSALTGHDHVLEPLEVLPLTTGPALVVAYAPGGSVARLLERNGGTLPLAEVVFVGRQSAGALVAAHEHGIVHRDVKPPNLLVDAQGQVRLCDFGVATLARADGFGGPTGALSPRYASPEDLEDDAEPTPASDVYSLGATLLHLVSGAPPTLRERVTGWTPAPADDPDRVALDEIIAACLRPDPVDRPSAVEVRDRLEVIDRTLHHRCRALPVGDPARSGDLHGEAVPGHTSTTVVGTDRSVPPAGEPAPDRRRRWPWTAAALAVGGWVGVAVAQSPGPAPSATTRATEVSASTATVEQAVPTFSQVETTALPVAVVARPTGLPELDPTSTVWPFGPVGGCLVQVNGLDELMPVDCGEPHDLQRFAVEHLADGPAMPASATVGAACRRALDEFAGEAAGGFDLAVTHPSRETWARGDRRFQCLLGVRGMQVVGDAAVG